MSDKEKNERLSLALKKNLKIQESIIISKNRNILFCSIN